MPPIFFMTQQCRNPEIWHGSTVPHGALVPTYGIAV